MFGNRFTFTNHNPKRPMKNNDNRKARRATKVSIRMSGRQFEDLSALIGAAETGLPMSENRLRQMATARSVIDSARRI